VRTYSVVHSRDQLTHCFHDPRIVDNSIQATAFKGMVAPRAAGEREENETERGLRVADKGFLNTAVLRSTITFIDGEAGGASFRVSMASDCC